MHDGYLHILQASAKLLQDHHHEEIKSKTITTKRKRSGLVRGDGDKILFACCRQSQASNPSDKHRFGFRKKADMDITAGSGGVSAEDEDGGRQDGWLGTTLGMEAGFVAGDLGS